MNRLTTGILAAALAVMANQASAQVTTCQNRVVIDTIYQTGTGGNNYEYFVSFRNATKQPLTVDVTFSGFPTTITLFSPSLPGIPVGAYASKSNLKFGRGTNGNINTGTVARVYDAAAGTGPSVRLTNCRPT